MRTIKSLWAILNKNRLMALFILLIIPILGELKLSPFGTDFRFALSSIAFMMVLLLAPDFPKILTGLIVGIVMVIFRISLDIIIIDVDFFAALIRHYPAGIYYLALGWWLHLVQINKLLYRPVLPVVLTIIGDVGSNIVELAFRYQTIFTGEIYTKVPMLLIVATIRVVWIYGIINIVQFQKMKELRKQEQDQFNEMLMFISSLNCEAFFLKKTLKEMEQIMAKAYSLYQELLGIGHKEARLKQFALGIATEVHEVKKDSLRILAGISKIIELEKTDKSMRLVDIISLVVKANFNYAGTLSKKINFKTDIDLNLTINPIYPMLTILNNLVTNAVEASSDKGSSITIRAAQVGESIEVKVCDQGNGVAGKDIDLIFRPGYTTKFNDHGISSTGIGLTHVKELVTNLNGVIKVESDEKLGTCFTLSFPIERIMEEQHG